MNYFEIKPSGDAYIRTDSGTVLRKVGNGEAVNFADFNDDESLFVITYDSGRCEIRNRKNELLEVVAESDVEKAYFNRQIKNVDLQNMLTYSFKNEKILIVKKG